MDACAASRGIGCCIFHAGLLQSTGEWRFRWSMPFCLGRFLCTRFDMVGRLGFRVDGISLVSFRSVLDSRLSCGRSVSTSPLRNKAGSSR
jgi:hypothetical protein